MQKGSQLLIEEKITLTRSIAEPYSMEVYQV
jgi:hypothetical protein